MGVATSLLTVEEFLQFPEKPGWKRELREGVVVEMSGAHFGHEIVKSNVIQPLAVYLETRPIGRVFSEAMFVLGRAEAYIPDVAVLLSERMAAADRSQHPQCAPDLAVEIVSSEAAADLEHKVRSYLRHGSHAVWVAYPNERVVYAYDAQGGCRILDKGKTLEAPDLLPEFALPVARVFAGL